MRTIQVGNVTETVVERSDYPPARIKKILGDETIAVIGYGVQGRGQSLNMKDNGVRVIVGQREGKLGGRGDRGAARNLERRRLHRDEGREAGQQDDDGKEELLEHGVLPKRHAS